MAASVEQTYADALFSLVLEESGKTSVTPETVLNELLQAEQVFNDVPEFIKVMNTPTVSRPEKLELIQKTFENKVSDYTFRFLNLLSDKGRMGYFGKICRAYNKMYNEKYGIVEIVVITSQPLDEVQRAKIIAKMTGITGKTVKLKEKVDTSIIGGIIMDYGSTRLDGSVKTRLESLKKDIAGIIA